MKKQLNYNYAFLFYDVGEKRVQKVFKICKKYLSHFQKSVFRGDMTPSKFIQLRNELNRVIDKEEDFVCIIKLMNDNVFGEEVLGNGKKMCIRDRYSTEKQRKNSTGITELSDRWRVYLMKSCFQNGWLRIIDVYKRQWLRREEGMD